MKNDRETIDKINSAKKAYQNLLEKNSEIEKHIFSFLKLLEEFEKSYCSDTLGRQIGISKVSKIDKLKNNTHSAFSAMKNNELQKTRVYLAFDDLTNLVESDRS